MEYRGRACHICGRNGSADPLDKHHIFGGAYRSKSEKYGLCVYLCHHDCHIFGEGAVHRNKEVMQALHEYGQRRAMEENGWTIEEFRLEFGKSYISEYEPEEPADYDFCIIGDDPMPF